jgi:hypothetical protein
LAAGDLYCAIAIEIIQTSSSGSPPCSASSLSGCAGCRVEIACL